MICPKAWVWLMDSEPSSPDEVMWILAMTEELWELASWVARDMVSVTTRMITAIERTRERTFTVRATSTIFSGNVFLDLIDRSRDPRGSSSSGFGNIFSKVVLLLYLKRFRKNEWISCRDSYSGDFFIGSVFSSSFMSSCRSSSSSRLTNTQAVSNKKLVQLYEEIYGDFLSCVEISASNRRAYSLNFARKQEEEPWLVVLVELCNDDDDLMFLFRLSMQLHSVLYCCCCCCCCYWLQDPAYFYHCAMLSYGES